MEKKEVSVTMSIEEFMLINALVTAKMTELEDDNSQNEDETATETIALNIQFNTCHKFFNNIRAKCQHKIKVENPIDVYVGNIPSDLIDFTAWYIKEDLSDSYRKRFAKTRG